MLSQTLESMIPIINALHQPVFFVRDGSVEFCNRAAQDILISEGDAIGTYLGESAEFYARFHGQSAMQLELTVAGKRYEATLYAAEGVHIFIISACVSSQPLSLETLAVVAQTLRLPIANLFGAANTLFPYLEEQDDDRIQTQTAAMNRSFYQLLRMTGNLTDIGRFIAGEVQLFDEKTELREFFGEIYDHVAPLCKEIGLELRFGCPTRKFYGYIDRQKVERAVLNLLANAMKFTPSGGRIAMRVENCGHSVLVTISDNGRGITPDLLATVFRRYETRGLMGDPDWGMGFGLPLVRYIASLHGGTVILEGTPDVGTTVTMSLSLRREPEEEQVRSPLANYDYTGGFNHTLVELSSVLPSSTFDSVNVN